MVRRVLILGGTGMLGHVLFTQLSMEKDVEVYATVRSSLNLETWFSSDRVKKFKTGVDADRFDTIVKAIESIRPNIVINCIGLIKQLPAANDAIPAIAINALLPHQIAMVCQKENARLIHISTDCVFCGTKGNYSESDESDAIDLYGRTKYLGEVTDPHCITLRSSIIGHELRGKLGLIEWFLGQKGKIRGFTRGIYSGFPTVEFARIILEYVLPNPNLSGLYQISSPPISKYDLLRLVAERYGKKIEIEPFDDFVLDRSLDSTKFREKTGYQSTRWTQLVDRMYLHYIAFGYKR